MSLVLKMRSIILVFCFLSANLHAKTSFFGEPPVVTRVYGSESILKEINKQFDQGKTGQVVTLAGMKGVGKSSIARYFVEEQEGNYDFALWIKSQQSIPEQIEDFLERFQLHFPNYISKNTSYFCQDEDCYKKLKQVLESCSLRWVVIIDDANNYAEISQLIVKSPLTKKADYIVTSHDSSNWSHVIKVSPLDEGSAISMLQDISGKSDPVYSMKICKELNFHPFAIKISADFIRETPTLSLHNFYTLLTSRRSNMLSGPLKEVNNSFKLSLEKIKEESKEAYFLLVLGSLLGPDTFPQELLKVCFQHFYNDEVAFHNAIHTLTSFGVLSYIEKDDSNLQMYYFHDLLLDTLKKEITSPEKEEILKLVASVIKGHFFHRDKQSLDNSTSNLLRPLVNICQQALDNGMVNEDLLSLSIDIIEHILITKRDYKWGDEFISSVEPHFLNCKNKELQIKFFTYVGAENSNFRDANRTLRKAIDIYESQQKHINDDHPSSGYSYYIQANTYLGANYAFLGNLEESKKTYEKISRITKKHGYDQNSENTWSIFVNQVMHLKIKYDILFAEGKYDLAHRQMLHIFEIIDSFKATHSSPVDIEKMCIWFYGQKYLSLILDKSQNKVLNSIKKEIHAFLDRNQPESKDSPLDFNFSILYESLAIAELEDNNPEEAEKYINIAINILNKWFKNDPPHNDQAFAKLIMGRILYKKGDLDGSSLHLREALNIYETRLDFLSIDNVSQIYKLFIDIARATKNEIASEHFTKLYDGNFNQS